MGALTITSTRSDCPRVLYSCCSVQNKDPEKLLFLLQILLTRNTPFESELLIYDIKKSTCGLVSVQSFIADNYCLPEIIISEVSKKKFCTVC
jgi:hypothetical protein